MLPQNDESHCPVASTTVLSLPHEFTACTLIFPVLSLCDCRENRTQSGEREGNIMPALVLNMIRLLLGRESKRIKRSHHTRERSEGADSSNPSKPISPPPNRRPLVPFELFQYHAIHTRSKNGAVRISRRATNENAPPSQ